MSLFTSDSLPRGSYVDDRNNPPIISATYLLFTLSRRKWEGLGGARRALERGPQN
jgi:hypothetical protein